MSTMKLLCGMFLTSLFITGCASSQKLVTPPLYLQNANILYCTAVNLHSTDTIVDIQVFDEKGVKRCGIGPRTLAPGKAEYQVCNSDLHLDINPIRYCVFIYNGYPDKIVGSAQIDPPAGEAIPAVAVPASSFP